MTDQPQRASRRRARAREAGVRLSLAGGLAVAGPGAELDLACLGGPQPRLTAALLLGDRRHCWSPEELAAQLWPAGPPVRWRPAVRALVSQVRAALVAVGVDATALVHHGGCYQVQVPHLSVDVHEARSAVEQATEALGRGDVERAADLAAPAREILALPILTGVEGPWVDRLRGEVGLDHAESLLVLGRALVRQRRLVEARAVLAEALVLDAYREETWRELMRLEVAAGNAARACVVYDECRRRLRTDLGVCPSAPTVDLHQEILRGAGSGSSGSGRSAAATAAATAATAASTVIG